MRSLRAARLTRRTLDGTVRAALDTARDVSRLELSVRDEMRCASESDALGYSLADCHVIADATVELAVTGYGATTESVGELRVHFDGRQPGEPPPSHVLALSEP